MRISHKNKFIWISKPKTGSTSYRKLLDEHSDVFSCQEFPFHHHVTLAQLKSTFEKEGWNFEDYYKIVGVRNPYTLVLSLFTYGKPDKNNVFWWQKSDSYKPDELSTFTSFITNKSNHGWFYNRHRIDVYSNDLSGEQLADLVFPVDLKNEFSTSFYKNTGILLGEPPRLNNSEKSDILVEEVRDCFNSGDLHKVFLDIFEKDIARFDYLNPFK
ncbi:hypothetical protein [Shewanella phaeophyticola]|uniref:Sulfotransferase family protein n=1 Tax=Shewanella phaeophyticola TaxID=2978345 RepID=A0ABT2NZC2_9GAMM|nr:hypothetical protein [Shewanella sp. KJ10-1]MCT8985742.1 hypothetical protein [Shewanella sp. KJ10-1]